MPDPAVSLRRFGREDQPLAVIDGFAPDPAALRAAALAATFGPAAHAYPGLRAPLPDDYLPAVAPVLARLAREAFGGGGIEVIDASFSLVCRPAHALDLRQRLPHYDALRPDQLALVHYLMPDEHGAGGLGAGGTGFFRHRSTGFETVDADRAPVFLNQLEAELRHGGLPAAAYPASSDRLFELTEAVAPAFNRAVVYRGHALHSGLISAGAALPADPAAGRLTVTAFFTLTGAP